MTIRFRIPPELEPRLIARAERNGMTAIAAALRILDDHADDDTPLAPWAPADPLLTGRRAHS